MEEESKNLIPDPATSEAPSVDSLPTASIITNEEEHPLIPADPKPLEDNGSLVPDSDVIESGEHGSEAKKGEPVSISAKEDDGYRVPPEPTNDIPVAGAIKVEDKKAKTKKPLNIKMLAIIGGSVLAVVALALVAIFVVVPIVAKSSRISLDNTIKSAIIREKSDEESKFAIFNADGKQLTDFIFSSATEFSDGYALVSDSEGVKSGIVSAGGAMSVEFGKYGSIKKIGSIYEVTNDDGLHRLIKGSGETIADVMDKVEYYDNGNVVIAKSNDKYYVVDARTGDRKFEYELSDQPKYSHDPDSANFNIISKSRVLIFADNSLDPIVDQKTKKEYAVSAHSRDYKCLLLRSTNEARNYGVLYKGKFKEIAIKQYLSLREYGSLPSDGIRIQGSCAFYTDGTANYNAAYRDGFMIMNDSFELVNRPYTKSTGTTVLIIDADHMLTYTYDKALNGYNVEFYVNGVIAKRVKSRSSPTIIDGNSYALSLVDENYKYTYYLYSPTGEILQQSTEHSFEPLDEFNNRLTTKGICSKDYKALAPGISTYDLTRYNNYYLYKKNSDKTVNLIDPSTGKFMLSESVYSSIVYNEDNNLYTGTRGNGETDILNDKFELITNVSGKVEMHQNYYSVSGASITELFTLKGEKFYTYE